MTIHSSIADLDLSAVHRDLVTRSGKTEAEAAAAVVQYRKFLELVRRHRGAPICPPAAADEAWHHHIQRTVAYRRDCMALFGRFIDHDPDAFGTEVFRTAWAQTVLLWRLAFDEDLVEDADALGAGANAPSMCYLPPLAA